MSFGAFGRWGCPCGCGGSGGCGGSLGAWGADAPASSASSDWLAPFAPIVSQVLSDQRDPYREAALLRVELQDALRRGASAYKIESIRAKLEAAERRAAERNQSTTSKAEWGTIGKVAAVLGVVVLLGSATVMLRRATTR